MKFSTFLSFCLTASLVDAYINQGPYGMGNQQRYMDELGSNFQVSREEMGRSHPDDVPVGARITQISNRMPMGRGGGGGGGMVRANRMPMDGYYGDSYGQGQGQGYSNGQRHGHGNGNAYGGRRSMAMDRRQGYNMGGGGHGHGHGPQYNHSPFDNEMGGRMMRQEYGYDRSMRRGGGGGGSGYYNDRMMHDRNMRRGGSAYYDSDRMMPSSGRQIMNSDMMHPDDIPVGARTSAQRYERRGHYGNNMDGSMMRNGGRYMNGPMGRNGGRYMGGPMMSQNGGYMNGPMRRSGGMYMEDMDSYNGY